MSRGLQHGVLVLAIMPLIRRGMFLTISEVAEQELTEQDTYTRTTDSSLTLVVTTNFMRRTPMFISTGPRSCRYWHHHSRSRHHALSVLATPLRREWHGVVTSSACHVSSAICAPTMAPMPTRKRNRDGRSAPYAMMQSTPPRLGLYAGIKDKRASHQEKAWTSY